MVTRDWLLGSGEWEVVPALAGRAHARIGEWGLVIGPRATAWAGRAHAQIGEWGW